jgi:hypothetical protein
MEKRGIALLVLITAWFFIGCSSVDRIRIEKGIITAGECSINITGCVVMECGELIDKCVEDQAKCFGLAFCLMNKCSGEAEHCFEKLRSIANMEQE